MTRRFSARVALMVPAAGILAGCDLLTGSNGERVIGIIGWEYSSPAGVAGFPLDPDPCLSPSETEPHCHLLAPDTVQAGDPFEVVVRTSWGGGPSCMRADGAEVSASPTTVEIIPYDRYFHEPQGWGCGEGSFWLPRTLTLTFPEPGNALLRLTGRVVIVEEEDEGSIPPDRWEYRMGSIDHPVVVR